MHWQTTRQLARSAALRVSSARLGQWLTIIIAGTLVYSNTFAVPFHFDDWNRIVNNTEIRSFWPPASAMSNTTRPFATYTFALNYAIHEYRVWGYHALNLAIHVCAGVCLFGLARLALQRMGGILGEQAACLALLIALLWTVHPIQTQAVTYVVQRLESLMGLAYLATLYCFARAQVSSRPRLWYAASVAACAFGMGCKEVMVTAPLLVVWYDRVFVANSWRQLWRSRGWFYLGLAGTWGVLVWAMVRYPDDYQHGALIWVEGLTPWTYLISQSAVLTWYLRLCLWPSGQRIDYDWPISESVLDVLPQALLIMALMGCTVWAMFRHPRWGFLGGWFFVILAPTSSVVPITDLAFEHRMYLPVAAVIAAFVLGGYILLRRYLGGPLSWERHKPWIAEAFTCIVVLGFVAHQRNRVYATPITLWQDAVGKDSDNARGWTNLGIAYYRLGQPAVARKHLDRAIQLDPQSAESLASLAGVLISLQEHELAIEHLEHALTLVPGMHVAHVNYGNAMSDLGRFAEAAAHYKAALVAAPKDHETMVALAGAMIPLGRFSEAEQLCRQAIELAPASAKAHTNFGSALLAQQQTARAGRSFAAAIALDPKLAEAHAALAQVLASHDHKRAMRHMREALRLNPASASINLGMGNLIAPTHPREAIEYYGRTLRAQPEHPQALFNLANALVACGQSDEAIAPLEKLTRLAPQWQEAQHNLRVLKRARDQASAPKD